MPTHPRRTTLNSSRWSSFRAPVVNHLGGVVVRPRAEPGVLLIAMITTGDVVENMIDSWEIGDGRSVALLAVKEIPVSGPTLRLLA